VHDFQESNPLENIFTLAEEKKMLDSIIAFASTSKITFAGSGVSFMAMSEANLDNFIKHYSSIVIGPDKVNQSRHIKFFKNFEGLKNHMLKHAEILSPKFELVDKWLSKQNFGSWTKPTGGYFVTFKSEPGLAKEIISLAKNAGLKLTPAGATFPYGVDPEDEIIRLAPTACTIEELEQAMQIFNACVALASVKKTVSS
jgi:DNA-binding transcriptional MocR family regulator